MLIPSDFAPFQRSTITHPSYSRVLCSWPRDGVAGPLHGDASKSPTQKSNVWTSRQG